MQRRAALESPGVHPAWTHVKIRGCNALAKTAFSLLLLLFTTLIPSPLSTKAYVSLADPETQLTPAQRSAIWQVLLPLNRGNIKYRVVVLRSLGMDQVAMELMKLSAEIPDEKHAVLLLVMEQKIFRLLVSPKALAGQPATSLDNLMQQSLPFLRAGTYDQAIIHTLKSLDNYLGNL